MKVGSTLLTALVVAMAAVLLASCAANDRCAQLPGSGRYCLVSTAGPTFRAEQLVTIRFQGKTSNLIARINSDEQGLRFAGLTPFGQTLIQLSWDHDQLRAELPTGFDGRLGAALFPALLQLATWPVERAREGLLVGLVLLDRPGGRVVNDGHQDLLIISFHGPAH